MEPTTTPTSTRFIWRVLAAVAVAVSIVLLLLLLWYSVFVFLLVFAGVLLAVFLHSVSSFIDAHTPLTYGWSLALVVLVLVALSALGVWQTGAALGEQIDELSRRLPYALQGLQERLERYKWAQNLLAELPKTGEQLAEQTDVVTQAPRVLSQVLGALGFFVVFLFLGLYLAINPGMYTRGLLRLVPPQKRDRVQEVLFEAGHLLGRWLVGRIFSMLVVGGIVTLGLWLMGVPLALALGLLAALGEFIPNIGPLLAFIPAGLLALTESTSRALAVGALYLGLQGFESFVLTPLVEKRAVDLPPALTIAAQVLLGLLVGAIGLVLAAPLAAVSMVLVQRLYIEDVLGDSMAVPLRQGESPQTVWHNSGQSSQVPSEPTTGD